MNQPVIQSRSFNCHTFGCCTLLHQSINPLSLLAKPSLGTPTNYISLQIGKLPHKNITLKIKSMNKYSDQGTLHTHTHTSSWWKSFPSLVGWGKGTSPNSYSGSYTNCPPNCSSTYSSTNDIINISNSCIQLYVAILNGVVQLECMVCANCNMNCKY